MINYSLWRLLARYETGKLLGIAYMNANTHARTRKDGHMHTYYSYEKRRSSLKPRIIKYTSLSFDVITGSHELIQNAGHRLRRRLVAKFARPGVFIPTNLTTCACVHILTKFRKQTEDRDE